MFLVISFFFKESAKGSEREIQFLLEFESLRQLIKSDFNLAKLHVITLVIIEIMSILRLPIFIYKIF